MRSVFKIREKGKENKEREPPVSPFPTNFSKAFFLLVI